MLNKYIDISVPISPNISRWPGSPPIKFKRTLDLDKGDVANDTTISFSVHTGTHIDAPLHFISNGKSIDCLPIEILIGRVFVAVLSDIRVITANVLEKLQLPKNTKRLLLRTSNSQLWQSSQSKFYSNFVALAPDAATWIVERKVSLIGIDYLSIQRFQDGPETHQILLKSDVVIVEGLNLNNVSQGEYELSCYAFIFLARKPYCQKSRLQKSQFKCVSA